MTLPKSAILAISTIACCVILGALWAYSYDEGAHGTQTTNDAYVQAEYSTVSSKVAGLIERVLIEENQPVRRGQLLAVIDDRDFRVAEESATAELETARANQRGLTVALKRQASLISQAKAQVDGDRAAVALSRANEQRYRTLASTGSTSQQQLQENVAKLDADEAALRRDQAALTATIQQVDMLQAELEGANAAVGRAQAALDAARLAITYTQITAPVDGVIGRSSVRIGNYVEVGKPLLAVVPLDRAYVEANFRETQLRHIKPGQPVAIQVDMIPGSKLHGRVQSVAPASGVTFAAIGSENATGNFTKIVQRLSVRIRIDPDQPEAAALRIGMSVVPVINTRGTLFPEDCQIEEEHIGETYPRTEPVGNARQAAGCSTDSVR